MKLIDLTHLIEPGMPVFPGTEPPILLAANTVDRDGFAEKKITLYSHTGTHMDAPAHMLSGGKTLDTYAAGDFFGPAVLADFSHFPLTYIEKIHLEPYESRLRGAKFLILRTGWALYWGKPDYFANFPALSPAAAAFVVSLGIKGIGIDAISIDRMEDHRFPVHHVLFKADLFIIENLTNLEQVETEFTLGCFPMQIKDADGAPVRAVAMMED
jgi:kynurenine formamidase